MAHVADHLSVLALEQQYRSCTDVTAARHVQTIWPLAKGHEIAEVRPRSCLRGAEWSVCGPAIPPTVPRLWAICGAATAPAPRS